MVGLVCRRYKDAVLHMMSPGLQRQFSAEVYAPLLTAVSFLSLSAVDPEVASECVAEVRPESKRW